MSWELRAGCKVNLFLDIVGVRANGYHEIESLFYPLSAPCDVLHIADSDASGLTLSCSVPGLAPEKNIVTKAYRAFADTAGWAPRISVRLEKGIPMGAGLGGGSSDAAALLTWLNARAGKNALDRETMRTVAIQLGADVPFFLARIPAWVTGIGENLAPLAFDLSGFDVVVVCPPVHVDTAWAYRLWDQEAASSAREERKPLTPLKSAIKSLSFTKHPEIWNCFESVIFKEFPVLYEIKKYMLDMGAAACGMSGSGSSVVALFGAQAAADKACGRMRALGYGVHVSRGERFLCSSAS